MLLYDITFKSIPTIKYNCTLTSPDYRTAVAENDKLFELCFVESGEFICGGKSCSLACEEGHLYPMLFSERCEIYTECERPVRMRCIGMECDLEAHLIDSDTLSEDETRTLMNNMLSGNRFLIAKNGISSFSCDWLLPYIQRISACSPGERIGEETRALSLFLDFMSRITKSMMDEIAFGTKAFPTSAIAYSEQAVAYIIKNYRKKITVAEMAHEFGLTPNYLHAIFKQVKGVTIVDYLTEYRLSLAKIYVERFGLKAYEAAHLVGIDDPAYFSRVFKKRYGVTLNSYKKKK